MHKIFMRLFLAISVVFSFLISDSIFKFINKKFTITNMLALTLKGNFVELLLFSLLFLVLFTALMYGVIRLARKFNFIKEKDRLATGDFARKEEFAGITGTDGLIIGKNFRLAEKKSFEHVVCVGPTGSGKSVAFFIPNLLSLPKASFVVSDPKGELFEKTAATNIKQGKRVLVFSPFKQNTMKYNPLALCRNVTEVRELSQVLLANGNASIEALTGTKGGGAEWTNMATPLLTSFMLYVRDLPAPKNTVSYALNLIVENEIETLKYLMEDADEAARRQFNVFMQSAESEKTASSIKTVLASNLQIFMDPLIETVTSENEIDPKMLRQQPTVLYCVVPEARSIAMAPIMSPFYNQLMTQLAEDGDGSPVFFLLDEFANIGKLPSISNFLATTRSRKIGFALGIQSINQLKQNYGNEEAFSILDNLKTKFAMPGLSYESANVFSQLIGFKEVSTTSTSFGKDNVSHSTSVQKRELMTADEVRRIPDEHTLIVCDNKQPFLTPQYRYYKDEKLEKLANDTLNINQFIENQKNKKKKGGE